MKPQCTAGVARRIERWEGEAVLDRMAQRLVARPDILATRRETVEHPFGSIKQWINQGTFLMKGLPEVCADYSPTAFSYDLRRAITIVGVPPMMKAVYSWTAGTWRGYLNRKDLLDPEPMPSRPITVSFPHHAINAAARITVIDQSASFRTV